MIVVVKNSPFGRHSSSHCDHFQCLFGHFLHALKKICEMLQAFNHFMVCPIFEEHPKIASNRN